jgi:hypothetical protein
MKKVEIKVIDEPEELDEAWCCRFTYYMMYYAPPPESVAVEKNKNEV